jgi:signal peptidase II
VNHVANGSLNRPVAANRYVVFFSIAGLGCLIDLVTKHYVFQWLGMPGGPIFWIWEPVFGFQTSLNEGALFGLGQGWGTLFALLSVIAAVAIVVWLFYAKAAHDLLLTVALGSITAGIFGNLYDRLGLPGLKNNLSEPVQAVRDWILVMIFDWPWPNFNIADSMLVCGAGLLVWHAFRHDRSVGPDNAAGA